MVSNASEDLPDPDRPVITVKLIARDIDVDTAQVVGACAANANEIHSVKLVGGRITIRKVCKLCQAWQMRAQWRMARGEVRLWC